jgi:hypothetical protein
MLHMLGHAAVLCKIVRRYKRNPLDHTPSCRPLR